MEDIIEKYKDSDVLYPLQDGTGNVIGQEIIDNGLFYIVKRGEEITVENSVDCNVVPIIGEGTSVTKKISISFNLGTA